MKTTKLAVILSAIALAVSATSAFAQNESKVDGGKVAVGLLGIGAGAGVWAWADNEADKEEEECERRNSGGNVVAICAATPGILPIGVAAVLGAGGAGYLIDGLTGWGVMDNFTHSGFVANGVTFGYTDSGKLGLQKKWEF